MYYISWLWYHCMKEAVELAYDCGISPQYAIMLTDDQERK